MRVAFAIHRELANVLYEPFFLNHDVRTTVSNVHWLMF